MTAKVLHDACCPVFTGPHLEHPPALDSPSFRHVLCAIDLGPQTKPVLHWARWFAEQFACDVSVVHALPGAATYLNGVYFDPASRNDLTAEALRTFDAFQAEMHTEYELRVEGGDPASVVSDAAQIACAGLVVIGRGHRHGKLGRLRDNAYSIVRESPCPVVTI